MPIGIDFLHVVEFSRYERAPLSEISHRLQGRPPNLVHTRRHGQTAPNEALDRGVNAVRPQSSVSQQEGNYIPQAQGGQIGVPTAFQPL